MTNENLNGVQEVTIGNEKLLCNKSVVPRPILSPDCRFPIFSQFHDLCHPDWKVAKRMILARITWPKLDKISNCGAKNIFSANRTKFQDTQNLRHASLMKALPDSVIYIQILWDLFQQFDSPHRYLVTFADRMTKWVEAQPVPSITAVVKSDAFRNSWFSRSGVPSYITTDRGSQFERELFECLAKTIDSYQLRTTAYQSQSNGQMERFYRTHEEALKSARSDWLRALPIVLFGIRIKPDENGISALSATTGLDDLFPNAIVNDKLEKLPSEYIRQLQSHLECLVFPSERKRRSSSKVNIFIPKELSECSHIWLRVDRVKQPLEAPYSGQHDVLSFKS